jgi:hypothetical protein
MRRNFEQIFELESAAKYNDAYSKYQKLISENNADFETWKYYFFFLWSMLEDVNGVFTEKIDVNSELANELKSGLKKYSELAEFNFVAGYTISIFPYEFGDYNELKKKGREMLKRTCELEPKNPIYKMVYLGSQQLNKFEQAKYEQVCATSQLKVVSEFKGKGLFNEYFGQILNRDGKASR